MNKVRLESKAASAKPPYHCHPPPCAGRDACAPRNSRERQSPDWHLPKSFHWRAGFHLRRYLQLKSRAAWKPPSFPRIGVGKANWIRPPLPPNRTGGIPASGSPVSGLTSERTEWPRRGPVPERTTPAWQRMHWGSDDGRCRALGHGDRRVFGGYFGVAPESIHPRTERCSDGYV